MKKVIATVIAAVTLNASALTFESGQVFSNGEVVHVSETAIGQKQLEENGYVVVGNNVVLDISEAGVGVETATVSIQEAIAGGDVLSEAIGEDLADALSEGLITETTASQLAELSEAAQQDVANAIENGSVDLDQLNEISSILEDAGLNLDDLAKTTSYEDAVQKFGKDVADKIEKNTQNIDEKGTCTNAAGQPC